ncbi:S-adenosyl-L-methionine-dependent methyltransferase [Polyporus arcularius HHB13444]|uniref:S-adenosyl-L-methionine-dependent methyltransferase n=1 Tax=Polyporus arcularius HHB13444 TaxID=1314778 RepID=A0A5C3PQA6_9APHY|nr:S-adenosyl-L-methionine-dependent methyltransferase [Polyporus arcularius HHB13444]
MCTRTHQPAPVHFSLVFLSVSPMAIDYSHQRPVPGSDSHNMPNPLDLDDDRTDSETSEDIVELSADEIPGYFQERGGRLFHSHGSCPYPLPVDAEEQQRQNGLHQLLRKLTGALSVGPVHDVLAHLPGEQRRVLDLGTGTGSWVLDMAREFPDVRFYGVDIVPIATRYPPRNVQFEMHDIKEQFRYNEGAIDMVHARSITMAIRDYSALLPEIARVLRSGGLFVSCEWGRRPAMADGSAVATRAPRAVAFFDAVQNTLLERRGIQTIADRIPQLLADSGDFTHIVARTYHMPIGDWHPNVDMQELGREYRDMVELYARSMRAVLLDGRWAAHADSLVQGYIDEIWSVRGLVSICYTVYAKRR